MNDQIEAILAEWYLRGEISPDPDDVIRAHPEHAAELRAHFAVLKAVDRSMSDEVAQIPPAPQEIGDYRIVREIGRGGMGVVYEAIQTKMDRRVALKVLSLSITGTPQAVKRFQREAKAAGRLHHTNIVPVHDLDHFAGTWYYAMELVEGRSLNEVIAEMKGLEGRPTEESLARFSVAAPAPPETHPPRGTNTGDRSYFLRVAEMFAGVADALELAHQDGIIHRDIKPSNLLLDPDGLLKIVDFGLARFDDDALAMTMTGDLLGTPIYMSPEQAMAKRMGLDHRTDIYSLGATLYELLTLRPPFEAKSLQEVCSQIITKDPALPRSTNQKIPRDLETIVLKAMEKDRDKRYQSARELARDLRTFAEGGTIRARRIGPVGRAWRKVKRHRVRSSLAAAVVVLAVVGGILAVRAAREAELRAELEYAQLCDRAFEAGGRRDLLGEESSVALLSRAIDLLPERPEAYAHRAWIRGQTFGERLADVAAARARGLPERGYHLARALLFRWVRQHQQAEEEEKLAAALPGGDPRDLVWEGDLARIRGDHAQAEELLSRAIDGLPEHDVRAYVARGARALVRQECGDLGGTLEDLLVMRARGDRTITTGIRIASLWRRLGQDESAQAEFEQMLRRARAARDERTWYRLGEACLGRSERDWADQVSREGLKGAPDSALLLAIRAVVLARAREYAEALDFADRAVRRAPDLATAHALRGEILGYMERPYASQEALEKAMELGPGIPRVSDAYIRGLLVHDRTSEALRSADQVLVRHPFDARTHVLRGEALVGLGRCAEALAAADRACELAPRDGDVHERRARILGRMGREEEGVKALARARELLAPFGRHVTYATLEALGRHEEALAGCDSMLERYPDDVGMLVVRARALGRLGRTADALAACDRALERDPECTSAVMARAGVLLRLRRTNDALAAYDRLLRLTPGSPDTHIGRATALAALGRHAESLAACDRALDVEPANARAGLLRGLALLELGREDEADAAFERALARATPADRIGLDGRFDVPLIAGAHYGRGLVRLRSRRFADALAAFEQGLEADPQVGLLHRLRGQALTGLRRLDEALAALDRALELGCEGVHLQRGIVIAKLGDKEAALAEWAKEDHEPVAAHLRAIVLDELGRREEALAVYARAVDHYGERLEWKFHVWAAPRLNNLGRYAEALAACGRASKADPGDYYAHYARAYALYRLGRYEHAVSAWKQSLEQRRTSLVMAELAVCLARCPDPEIRDPRRAIELAREAVDAQTSASPAAWDAIVWRALGTALYSIGQYEAAQDPLAKALSLDEEDERVAGRLLLAMVKWHLGDESGARALYEQAAKQREERNVHDPELVRLDAEAAQLLGLAR